MASLPPVLLVSHLPDEHCTDQLDSSFFGVLASLTNAPNRAGARCRTRAPLPAPLRQDRARGRRAWSRSCRASPLRRAGGPSPTPTRPRPSRRGRARRRPLRSRLKASPWVLAWCCGFPSALRSQADRQRANPALVHSTAVLAPRGRLSLFPIEFSRTLRAALYPVPRKSV